MNWKKSLPFVPANGYVLPMALVLIALSSLATSIALQTASNHLKFLKSEKHYLEMFEATELKLIDIENQLSQGTAPPSDSFVQIESFRPKYFRPSKSLQTKHYKILVRIPHPHFSSNHSMGISSIIRIDELSPNQQQGKAPQRKTQRLQWSISHD